jgi:dCMP deaminase
MNKWDAAHMTSAEVYANLSSARRAKVGCVIVKDNRIVSIGYNGMPSGWDNNCEYGPDTDPAILRTKPEVLHAETNAIAKVARSNESCENASLYTTVAPCLDCAKLIYQSGISKVFWRNEYPRGELGLEFLSKCDIEVTQI